MITPDKVTHGIHAFIVEVRNPVTMLPPNGVTVGDLGEKLALNGVDNGFVIFNNYSIPRDSLLNKHADVTVGGQYVSRTKDKKKVLVYY